MTPTEKFGQLVKDLRKGRGWNRYRLRDKTGIAYKSLERYEAGETTPSLDRVVAIANAFGFDAADLLDEVNL